MATRVITCICCTIVGAFNGVAIPWIIGYLLSLRGLRAPTPYDFSGLESFLYVLFCNALLGAAIGLGVALRLAKPQIRAWIMLAVSIGVIAQVYVRASHDFFTLNAATGEAWYLYQLEPEQITPYIFGKYGPTAFAAFLMLLWSLRCLWRIRKNRILSAL